MKLPARRASTIGSVGMMPMIDVVFLLLVYFLWTTSFDPPPYELPGSIATPPDSVAMSSGQTTNEDPVEAFDEIIVRLRVENKDSSRRVWATMNDQAIDSPAMLSKRIKQIVDLGVNPPIIVDPELEVTMSDVIAYYDAARIGGGDRVLFAVSDDQ